MKQLFISDLHLDADCPQRLEAFERILQYACLNEANTYILGDLVEVWIGDDDDCEFADQLRGILRIYALRTPVYFMHGNRDFLIGSQFSQDTSIELLDDPTVITVSGKRSLLAHGDAYCTSDENGKKTF